MRLLLGRAREMGIHTLSHCEKHLKDCCEIDSALIPEQDLLGIGNGFERQLGTADMASLCVMMRRRSNGFYSLALNRL
jgi:hypothetical protein